MSRNQQGGGMQPRSRKRKKNSMTWRVLKILAICLLVAFAALAVLAVVRVWNPCRIHVQECRGSRGRK